MKKSFFKKLSFVMAFAMVSSIVAPAAGAFAAADPTINVAKKYLFLGEKNEYDFHIDNKVKGSKYEWKSSNENVAVVDEKTGYTTAVANGTATISCTIKTKKDTWSSETTVVVKDNIKTLAITGDPKDKALAVDATNDYNRTFTTQGGSTTATTSVTRWAVTDKDGKATTNATIDTKGIFKATAAGEYKITAMAFQSSAKYDAWKTSGTGMLTSAETTVTVAPSIVATKQVDADTFTVTFNSDMSKTDLTTAGLLYQVVAGKLVNTGAEKIKKITLDANGKVATVDTYATLVAEKDYSFVYGKLTGSFKAAKADLANVASISFSDFDVDVTVGYKDMKQFVSAYNSDGVKIFSGTDLSDSTLTFTYGGEVSKGNKSGNNAYIYAAGNTAKYTAKFNAVVFDATSKTYKTLTFTADANAKGVKADTSISASSLQYAAPETADATATDKLVYSATGVTVAAKDSNKIVTKYVTNDATSTTKYTTDTSVFTYKPTDADKLVINGNNMYPISTGTVTVLVYSGTTPVGSFDVTIVASRSFQTATQDTSSLTVGNNTVDTTGASSTIAIADSLGKAITATAVPSLVAAPATAGTKLPTVTTDVSTAGKVVVKAVGYTGSVSAETGVYSYKVTVSALGVSKELYYNITVVDGATTDAAKVSYYQVELSKTAIDVKGLTNASVDINVFGYNAAGIKVKKLNNTEYTVEVKDSNNNAPANAVAASATSIAVVTSASGAAVKADANGNYVVTAKAVGKLGTNREDNFYLGAATLTVSDSTTTSFKVDSTAVSAPDVITLAKNALTLVFNGADVSAADESKIVKVTYSKGATVIIPAVDASATVAAGDNVFIENITYRVANTDNSYTDYTFAINKTFSVK